MTSMLATTLRCFMMIFTLHLVTACQTSGSKTDTGTLLGAVVGGVAGAVIGNSSLGDHVGQAASIAIGATAGAIAGNLIGAKLDEIDRLEAEAAKRTALSIPTGDKVEWRSKQSTSTRGFASPISERTSTEGRQCRTVRQVAYIKGKEVEETSEFCKVGETGRWVPA